MKKQLLASTAIVAAGVIGAASTATAQGLLFTGPSNSPQTTQTVPPTSPPAAGAPRINIQIDGRMRAFFSAVWQNDRGPADLPAVGTSSTPTLTSPLNNARERTTNVLEEARIRFRGTINLDNGFQPGFNMEIRTQDGSNTTATTNYIFRQQFAFVNSARFGLLQVGTQGVAGSALHYKEPDVHAGRAANFLNDSHFITRVVYGTNGSFGALVGTDPTPSGINGVAYYTPRIEGFQLGISWMPTYNRDAQFAPPGNGPQAIYQDILSVGINFDRTFDIGTGLRVRASYGYTTADEPDFFASQVANPGALGWSLPKPGSPRLHMGGLRLAYQGFEVGGSVASYSRWTSGPGAFGGGNRYAPGNAFGSIASGAANAGAFRYSQANIGDGLVWGVGGAYSYGPAAASINYIDGRASDCNITGFTLGACGGRDRLTAIGLGLSYQLGPGVFVEAQIFHGRLRGNQWNAGTYLSTVAVTGLVGTTTVTLPAAAASVAAQQSVQNNRFTGFLAGLVVNF